MAEKAQSGLLCLSLLQFLMLGCLIYVIANTKNELQLLQEKVNSRIGVEAENENHVKRSKNSTVQYSTVYTVTSTAQMHD